MDIALCILYLSILLVMLLVMISSIRIGIKAERKLKDESYQVRKYKAEAEFMRNLWRGEVDKRIKNFNKGE